MEPATPQGIDPEIDPSSSALLGLLIPVPIGIAIWALIGWLVF